MSQQKRNKKLQSISLSSLSEEILYAAYKSSLGRLWIGIYQNKLCFISKELSPLTKLKQIGINAKKTNSLPTLLKKELDRYFYQKSKKFDFPVHFLFGTAFQQKVWETLQTIPYGETRSYAWVAQQIGQPQAVRAVGNANGKNPIPIIIPCHRVIQSNGSLGGYSGGLSLKKKLLELEGITL